MYQIKFKKRLQGGKIALVTVDGFSNNKSMVGDFYNLFILIIVVLQGRSMFVQVAITSTMLGLTFAN